MDPQLSDVPVKSDDTSKNVSSSCARENIPAERVQGVSLDSNSSKSEWTTSTASIHLTTKLNDKAEVFEEEEEGELDYEEDEGEIAAAQQDRNGMKSDDDDKEEGELEDDEQEEGEEGEILSDEDNKATRDTKTQEKHHIPTVEADGPEEGEVIEEGETSGGLSLRKKVCRYFTFGGCTWGMSCRFLHPGLNDKGAYQMLPIPGQYPSPFPKPPVIPPVPAEAIVQGPVMTSYQDHEEQVDEIVPELPAAAKKETAWERGLKLAKEIKKAAQKRKEEDADFEEKRMVLGITAEDNEDENDKENLTRRREMLRNRVEKELIVDEDDARYRRGGDIVSRWRDKRPTSPMHYKDRDRRKRRGNRSPSSSPERDRRNRRRTGDSEKVKTRTKDTTRERDKERSKKTAAAKDTATDGKPEEKVKKQKEQNAAEENQATGESKQETAVTEVKATKEEEQMNTDVKQQQQEQEQQQQQQQRQEMNLEQRKTEPDDRRKIKVPEKGESTDVKPTKETDKKVELIGGGAEEKDKLKTKVLGISSSRLPNDEWIDPWQRTTSPKRHSVSSASSRSRSSSSSSDSSRSSRSRSHSGSESRSTSHSASRSRSRSASHTPSRSPSRSHSRSRSKTRSRSGSVSSASEHSSSSSSKSAAVEVKPGVGWEEKNEKQASHDSSDSESGSESESNPSISKSKSKSPDPVPKSPVKPKPTTDKGPRTPPKESTLTRNVKDVKDRKNRFEYGRRERIEKGRPMRQAASWNRRLEGSRLTDDHNRDRDYHSRTRKNLDRRRRSRSPARARNGDRRRLDEGRTRERSSSADSMEHALARPSSPRPTRERGGLRRGSGVSSSDTESASSDSESESEEEEEEDRNLVRTRRAGPETDQVKRNIPLSSGNIRYTGHKDIKLTLNKSVSRPDRGETKPPSHHPPQERTEASSSSEKQVVAKKRTRDSSPVLEASNPARDVVSSSVPAQTPNKNDKRSADSQVDTATSGKANTANTSSRREELLRELKAVEDAIARKRARIE